MNLRVYLKDEYEKWNWDKNLKIELKIVKRLCKMKLRSDIEFGKWIWEMNSKNEFSETLLRTQFEGWICKWNWICQMNLRDEFENNFGMDYKNEFDRWFWEFERYIRNMKIGLKNEKYLKNKNWSKKEKLIWKMRNNLKNEFKNWKWKINP